MKKQPLSLTKTNQYDFQKKSFKCFQLSKSVQDFLQKRELKILHFSANSKKTAWPIILQYNQESFLLSVNKWI